MTTISSINPPRPEVYCRNQELLLSFAQDLKSNLDTVDNHIDAAVGALEGQRLAEMHIRSLEAQLPKVQDHFDHCTKLVQANERRMEGYESEFRASVDLIAFLEIEIFEKLRRCSNQLDVPISDARQEWIVLQVNDRTLSLVSKCDALGELQQIYEEIFRTLKQQAINLDPQLGVRDECASRQSIALVELHRLGFKDTATDLIDVFRMLNQCDEFIVQARIHEKKLRSSRIDLLNSEGKLVQAEGAAIGNDEDSARLKRTRKEHAENKLTHLDSAEAILNQTWKQFDDGRKRHSSIIKELGQIYTRKLDIKREISPRSIRFKATESFSTRVQRLIIDKELLSSALPVVERGLRKIERQIYELENPLQSAILPPRAPEKAVSSSLLTTFADLLHFPLIHLSRAENPTNLTRKDIPIRWMVRRELARVVEIEKNSFESPWKEEKFLDCLRNRDCIGMVAEYKGNVVGYMIYELFKTKIHMLNFAVDPDHRRIGVGSAMVERLIEKLDAQRRSEIYLELRETNRPGYLFFTENGFKASVLHNHYPELREDAYQMSYSIFPAAFKGNFEQFRRRAA